MLRPDPYEVALAIEHDFLNANLSAAAKMVAVEMAKLSRMLTSVTGEQCYNCGDLNTRNIWGTYLGRLEKELDAEPRVVLNKVMSYDKCGTPYGVVRAFIKAIG